MYFREVALKAGREFLRKETGFIHYFYHARPRESHATIPVYENLAWALALFQQRTQEGVLEGKEGLARLLAFQNAEGEFPVYLHEFPKTTDYFLGAYLFYPLYWIWKDFGPVMGHELQVKCERALKEMVKALKRRFDEKKPEGHIRVKVAGALFAMLEEKIFDKMPLSLVSSAHIADIELARELAVPGLPEWSSFFWHPQLECYTGPAYKELQEGLEPEVTLLDLMMGSKRQRELTPHHILAALIRSSPVPTDQAVRGVKHHADYAYAALEKEGDAPLFTQPGFHLFRFLTRGEKGIDSLAFQGAKLLRATYKEAENGVVFILDLPPVFEPDVREKQREVELFVNLGPKIPGSVFRLGEPVVVTFNKCQVIITFRLTRGEGDFIGQISRGNRPAQIIKGEAFDQVLSLRTLRRSSDAQLEMRLEII